jgi:hypothetical protein
MHYCRNCRKWNDGWPLRCRYCSAGLEGRLCPSGHVNPPDRDLQYCGDCGRPLESKWGAGFSFQPYLLALGVVIITLLLSAAIAHLDHYAGQADAPLVTAIMVLVIVVVGFRLAFRILPPWVANFIGDVVSFFIRLILGTGIKGKK